MTSLVDRGVHGERYLWAALGLLAILGLAGCGEPTRSAESFERYVRDKPIGAGGDYWIEMQNTAGQWERVGLVFGYYTSDGTKVECENALLGLRKVNYARQYRCSPANLP